jgi:hypothetical protein
MALNLPSEMLIITMYESPGPSFEKMIQKNIKVTALPY